MRLIAIVAVAVLAVACQTPGGGTGGMDTGSTAAGGQGAQTIGGSQGLGQTPQDTVGGLATQNWWFASQGDPAIQAEIIKYARETKASMTELKDALTALSGAPQTVTINAGDTAISGGNAEAVGATTGAGENSGVAPNPSNP